MQPNDCLGIDLGGHDILLTRTEMDRLHECGYEHHVDVLSLQTHRVEIFQSHVNITKMQNLESIQIKQVTVILDTREIISEGIEMPEVKYIHPDPVNGFGLPGELGDTIPYNLAVRFELACRSFTAQIQRQSGQAFVCC